jgi:DNA-directed RNA polymerase subunit RPC12/RpoP
MPQRRRLSLRCREWRRRSEADSYMMRQYECVWRWKCPFCKATWTKYRAWLGPGCPNCGHTVLIEWESPLTPASIAILWPDGVGELSQPERYRYPMNTPQCAVHDNTGRHCPEPPTHEVDHQGKRLRLCDSCHSMWLAGAYGPKLPATSA